METQLVEDELPGLITVGRSTDNRVESNYKISLAIKRAIDIIVSFSALLALWPFLLAIGLAVKLDSPGPAFYKHRRIGRGGKPFDLYKFRSMFCGGDDTGYMQYLQELIESERNGDGEGLPYAKMDEDKRITRIGRFIRNYYLDEIPQVINVLKGEMSLVGPRPHVQFEVDCYTPEQCRRLVVKPGVTGLWQVEGKADCTFSELIDLDLKYIENWSLITDWQIIVKTAMLIFRGGEHFWTRLSKDVPS